MKKLIVFTLTAAAIAFVFLMSLTARKFEARAPTAVQPFGRDSAADMPMAMEEPMVEPAPEAPKMRAKKKAEKETLSLGLFGSGKGGGGSGEGVGLGGLGKLDQAKRPEPKPEESKEEAAATETSTEGGVGAPTRAWFPETFLFEPLVVTDEQGRANVPVKVPDRLTTWRVLALAHSRQGGQAGSVASFLGTLPTYVEPVTPAFLYAGDAVRLPVQVVNTTDADVTSPLKYAASGAELSAVGGTVRVPAGGSTVEYVTLTTKTPGNAVLRATLGDTDAVEKSIPVQPAGKRELLARGGTLAAPRTFELIGPANALPGTESLRLRIFPGALGLVRSELSAAIGRGGVAEDAYLLQLLGDAPAIIRALGADPAEPTIRDLRILATQRVMRHARAPSVDAATLLTEAALAHPENPVLSRLGERLAMQVAQSQRGDGTCQGADGWTLQRLLVTTADCVRAARASTATPQAKQRATAVSLKASGAFERNLQRVNDGYTAAAILSSGAVSGNVADTLKKLVLDGLQTTDDGGRFLSVGQGVVRPDGASPSTYEATALAILALKDDPKAPLADLGTYLLGGYSAVYGWGDGRANLVALRAAVQLFKDPVPAGVKIVLERDGKQLASGELSAAALKDVLVLDADATGSSGAHTWTIRADPPVPGLGYSLDLVAFTPWKAEPGGGLDLTTTLPKDLQVGRAGDVELTAAMPAGLQTELGLSLPAGVQADTPQLDRLVSSGAIVRYETQDGLVTLHVPPQPPGAVFTTKVRVVPTLAGTLQSGPSTLGPEGQPRRAKAFAPVTWKVK